MADDKTPAKTPALERFALGYLERRAAEEPPPEDVDGVHVLNPEERKALRGIERGMVGRAALAGAASGLIAAIADVLAYPLLGVDPESASIWQVAEFWLVVGPVIGVAAAFEIGFLYWDALRSVHELSRAAGLTLFDELDRDGEGPSDVATAMARAALELPNPQVGRWGIDPHREVSKLRLLAATVLYKAKVGVSSFLIKALLRRLAGRALLRVWLVFVGVPVTALWDAAVAFKVIREARLRAMGPSAAKELVRAIFEDHDAQFSDGAEAAILRAVGGSIVRTHDRHPNLLALLHELDAHHLGARADVILDDTALFLDGLGRLDGAEQEVVLRVLAVAAVIDGRLAKDECKLLAEAQRRCGREPDLKPIRKLLKAFVAGDLLDVASVAATTGRRSDFDKEGTQ